MTTQEFQSTLPRGERRPRGKDERSQIRSFNPRSRAGSDSTAESRFSALNVSIHAPARGATLRMDEIELVLIMFQSTLPRGERRLGRQGQALSLDSFNPRSRAGSDSEIVVGSAVFTLFQSTLPRGERLCRPKLLYKKVLLFQSTLPRGERQS